MKIYRVNMSNLTATVEDVPQEWQGLGGRALTSAVVAKEVEPTCHPPVSYTHLTLPTSDLV